MCPPAALQIQIAFNTHIFFFTSHFNIISSCAFCSSIIPFLCYLPSLFTHKFPLPSLSSSTYQSLHLLNLFAPTQCSLSLSHSLFSISPLVSFCFPLSLFALCCLFVCLSGSFSWDEKWRKQCTHNSYKITLIDQIQFPLSVSVFVLDCFHQRLLLQWLCTIN